MNPQLIQVREPEIGSKGFLIEKDGLFVLSTGPGLLRGIACTHAGSGMLVVHDGVPTSNGFFENRGHRQMAAGSSDEIWRCARCDGAQCPMCFGAGEIAHAIERVPCPVGPRHCSACRGTGIEGDYWSRNGRVMMRLNQMGMWMFDAGFHHGLSIAVAGGTPSVHIIATITWLTHGD